MMRDSFVDRSGVLTNKLAKDLLSNRTFEDVELAPKLQAMIDAGFVATGDGCYLLLALQTRRGADINRERLIDETGIECFVNGIAVGMHLDNTVTAPRHSEIEQAIAFAESGLAEWRRLPRSADLRAVVSFSSVDDASSAYAAHVTFHVKRLVQPYGSDNLESYIQPVVILETSRRSPAVTKVH